MIHDDGTHLLCIHCWHDRAPDRAPTIIVGSERRDCCRCGLSTTSGTFVRAGVNAWGRCVDG